MRKKIIIPLIILITVAISVSLQSCSEYKEDIVGTNPVISGVHPQGWLDHNSPNYKGLKFSGSKWKLDACKPCHGNDFRGGGSGSSCYTCHPGGPLSCNVCHGNSSHIYPPAAILGSTSVSFIGVGVHETHLGDSSLRNSAQVACSECHRSFTGGVYDTIHINPNNINNIAEVFFGPLAKTPNGGITPNPVWNRTTATCAGGYCHGNFRNGNYRLMTTPPSIVWTNPNTGACGTCHGNPTTGDPSPGGTHPVGYSITECSICHGTVMGNTGNFVNKSLHINGTVNYNAK